MYPRQPITWPHLNQIGSNQYTVGSHNGSGREANSLYLYLQIHVWRPRTSQPQHLAIVIGIEVNHFNFCEHYYFTVKFFERWLNICLKNYILYNNINQQKCGRSPWCAHLTYFNTSFVSLWKQYSPYINDIKWSILERTVFNAIIELKSTLKHT